MPGKKRRSAVWFVLKILNCFYSYSDAVVEEGAPAMGAKALCIPFDQPEQLAENQQCCHPACKSKAKYFTLFGRSY